MANCRWLQAAGGGAGVGLGESAGASLGNGRRTDGQSGGVRSESGRTALTGVGRGLAGAGVGAGGRTVASGDGGATGPAQELGMPPAGALGEAQCGSAQRPGSGRTAAEPGAAIVAVARGQPG